MKKKSSRLASQSKLPKKLVSKLGKRTDRDLAREFDVSELEIGQERRRLGIAACGWREWTKKEIALLGTASDAEIAQRINRIPSGVFLQRTRRNIPAFGQNKTEKAHRWTKQQIKWLGKVSDVEIANRLGVSASTVAWKRRKMGIPSRTGSTGRKVWTAAEIKLLGTMSDIDLAQKIQCHRHKVALKRVELGIPNFVMSNREDRWSPEIIKRLETETDAVIAEELGVTVQSVGAFRRRHGILRNRRARIDWNASLVKKLGKVSDQELADSIGASRASVAMKRKSLNIPPMG